MAKANCRRCGADFSASAMAGRPAGDVESAVALQDWTIPRLPIAGGVLIARGLAAVHAKGEWWYANHEIHSVEASGPFVNGDQFIVRFKMDLTFKPSGERMQNDEDGLYTVKDGKIVEERFFY